jgi:imidazolonepropionase-like amidohydrolase
MDMHAHPLVKDVGNLEDDMYKYSAAFRSLRGASYLWKSINNGFTTIRDMGSVGAGYANIDLARAVEQGFIVGPRIYPCGPGIAVTGSFFPDLSQKNWELDHPPGAQFVSGKDECLKAVREQIGQGATWIKIWADWGAPTFNPDELSVIVREAKKLGLEVAAHADPQRAIEMVIEAGVRSIEHGFGLNEELIHKAIDNNVFLCPTITAFEFMKSKTLNQRYKMLKLAYSKGMKIALGSDAGAYPWNINQASELIYWVEKAEIKPMDAIKSATSIPAELLGRSDDMGQIKKGYVADIIAIKGNPLEDIRLIQKVDFVMKAGFIIKNQ